MKVLLVWENRVRADSTCVYFKRAFEKIADLVTIYPEELPYIRPGIFDLHVLVDFGLDLVWPVDLKPSVYYAIDTHIHAGWRLEMAKKADFDYVFMAQKKGLDLAWHTDKKFWLPLGCEPETHSLNSHQLSAFSSQLTAGSCQPTTNSHQLSAISQQQNKRQTVKTYDVCFIGNTQPGWQARRVDRLDKLFREFPNFYYGNKFFREATEKYAESKLVFNSAYSDDINMRVFEVLCSGSCLLTDTQDWKGLGLEPGKHFVEYTDEDMLEKAEYFLKHEEVREQIAAQGQKEVMEKHTYSHRVREMMRVIQQNSGKNENTTPSPCLPAASPEIGRG